MKKILLFVVITSVWNLVGQVPAYVPTLNLLAYYPFNGNANDASINNHNGTPTNVTVTSDRFSNSNSAYSFNGTSSGIQLSTTNTVSFPSGVTFCAWISATGFTNASVVDDMDGVLNPDIGFRLCSRSLTSPTPVVASNSGWYGSGIAAFSTSQYSLNTWCFIAASWGTDDSLRVYFNGIQQQAIYSVYTFTNTMPIYIGRGRLNSGYEVFNGKIDDVSIHARVLTRCEIYSMYTGTTMTMPVSGVSNTICSGTTLTLSVSGLNTYTWNSSSVSSSIVVSPITSQSYSVSGRHTLSGCIINSVVPIAVSALPTITINGSGSICLGGSKVLIAGGASTYSWSTGITNQSISVSPTITTSYSVVATNSNGCTNSTSISIQVNPLPNVAISAAQSSLCSGQTISVTAVGANTYTWSTNQNTSLISISPSISTTYSVIGTSSLGCNNTATLSLTVKPLPIVSIQGASIICLGETTTLTATGAVSYTWGTGQNIAVVVSSPTTTSNYSLIGTDQYGCSNTSNFILNVDNCVGIQSHQIPHLEISLFPNPSSGLISIKGLLPASGTIIITSMTGEILLNGKIEELSLIDLSGVQDGTYLIRILDQSKLIYKGVVIKH